MATASSSAVQVGYITESSWGVTPSAAVQYFRATSASIKPAIQTVTSDELRADGQVTDSVQVGASGTASFGFEFSYGNGDDFMAAACRAAWSADHDFDGTQAGTDLLENGTTLKSFTLEAYFSDIAQYAKLTGARINSLSLSVQAEQKITGQVEFIGKVASLGGSSAGTGTATAAPTNDVMSAVNLSSFSEGGSAMDFLQFDININNNAAAQMIAGAVASSMKGVRYGRFVVTGSLRAYFADATLINKYINHTASTLELALADAAGNAMAFQFPRIRYTDTDFPVSGNDQDVVIAQPFQAVLDPTTVKTMRVTRTDAT